MCNCSPVYEDLKGKTLLITGGTGGLGEAFCREFARNGANLCICYNTKRKKALELQSQLEKKHNIRACVFQLSQEDHKSCREVTAGALEHFGQVDCLINNAAMEPQKILFEEASLDYINRLIDVNIKGPINMCQSLLPHFRKRRKGVIVNIGSIWGQTGRRGSIIYGLTKQSTTVLTRMLAMEYAVYRIRVNSIIPGYFDTGMARVMNAEDLKIIKKSIPLRRLGTGEEIARVAAFLCSDHSSYITGQQVSVNGGAHML